MRTCIAVCTALTITAAAWGQPPSDPALLIPQQAPLLDYIPVANGLSIPDDVEFGLSASVTFDAQGHLWVLNRGPTPVSEFDENGRLLRAFGDGLFGNRPHSLTVDADGNVWVADGSTHIVVKFNPQGDVLMSLGTRGAAGDWNETTGERLLNQPNEVAIGDNGDIFIAQGHTPGERGDPRVLKFDRNGRFIRSWGGKGSEPGKFQVAHSVVIDDEGLLWVADRENQRFQVFDQDGNFIRQHTYAGLPCSIAFTDDGMFMVNGFTGQLLKLDASANVLAALGQPGDGPGEFGEAHYVAVSPTGAVYVADVTRGVQKFVER